MNRTIFTGDNLDVLRGLGSGLAGLIYVAVGCVRRADDKPSPGNVRGLAACGR